MANRGRPRHPDILTPREWEVLALVRDGLTNAEIAERLGITLAGARYHVSEILSKLGVATREEAAGWEPEAAPARGWGLALCAKVALGATAVAVLAGLGILAWAVTRSDATDDGAVAAPSVTNAPPMPSPAPGVNLTRGIHRVSPGEYPVFMAQGDSYAVSPGGEWLAYTAPYVSGKEVFLTTTRGGASVTKLARFQGVSGLAVAPDGGRVLVLGRIDTVSGLYVVDAATGEVTKPLAMKNSQTTGRLAWSPTGEDVAFLGTPESQTVGLYITDTDSWDFNVLEDTTGGSIAPHWRDAAADFAWSPNGSLIALSVPYGDDSGIFVADLQGRSVQKVSETNATGPLTWAPDASRLAFADGPRVFPNGPSDVRVLDIQSGDEEVLVGGLDPAWSPDGEQIAFLREGGLYVIGADGEGELRVGPTLPFTGQPSWLPDGELVFLYNGPPQGGVYAVEVETGREVYLMDGAAPAWSPDGWSIGALEGVGGLGFFGHVIVRPTAETGSIRLGDVTYSDAIILPSCRGGEAFAWSRDGSRVAFGSDSGASVAMADGGEKTVVSDVTSTPSWSSDGARIVYSAVPEIYRYSPDAECKVHVSDIDGGHATAIAVGTRPSWSPDGRLIAFVREGSLYVVQPDGGGERRLAEGLGEYGGRLVRWSPDSSRLAFTAGETVVAVSVEGEEIARFAGDSVDWSPDGTRLAFSLRSEVYVMDADGEPEPELLAAGEDPDWSPDGKWVAFSRDDADCGFERCRPLTAPGR